MMNLKILFFVFFAFGFIFFGCKSEDDLVEGDLIWNKRFPIKILASSMDPVLFGDLVVYSNDFILADDLLMAYDKKNGKHQWTIDDLSLPGFNGRTKSFVENNILYLFQNGKLVAINREGDVLWRKKITDKGGSRNMIAQNGTLFLYGGLGDNSGVFRVDKKSGDSELLLEYSHELHYADIKWFHFFNESNTDYLAVYVKYLSRDFSFSYDTTFIYNTENFQLVSKNVYLSDKEGAVIDYHNEYILAATGDSLYRISILNKEVIWSVPKLYTYMNHIHVHEDGIYFVENKSPGNNALKIIRQSLHSGEVIWEIDHKYAVDRITLFESNLYVNRYGKLLILETLNGDHKKEIISPDYDSNSNAFFDEALTIDPNSGDIYTANYVGAQKFKYVD